MTSVNEGSTVLAGYGYDGFSRRTHSILFDGDGNPSNQLTTSYEYANDNALTTLNQYTETEAALLLANGQPDPNPAPETVTATAIC